MRPLHVYPDATIIEPDVPRRSRLYNLAPRAVGTPLGEALASYGLRLAEAHSLPFGALIAEEVAPLMSSAARRPAEVGEILASGAASMVIGELGRRWCGTLSALTTVALEPLTLLKWEEVLSRRHLVHESLRFCPECLDAFGAEPYEPLAWSLRRVTACPVHARMLVDRCPACGLRQRSIRYRAVPGACRGCRAPLRTATPGGPAPDWDRWSSASLSGLVSASGASRPTAAELPRAIEAAIQATGGSRTRLANLIGLSSTGAVALWLSGSIRPSVDILMRVCAVGKWDLAAFLDGRLVGVGWAPDPADIPSRPKRREIDWSRLTRQADRALRTDGVVPSVPALAARLGVSESSLEASAPKLVARAVAARRTWIGRQATARRDGARAIIDEAVASLVRDGVAPSARRVQTALPKPLSLREPALKEAWIAAMARNGLGACPRGPACGRRPTTT